ncbi:MAG: carbonic anhydrase [Bdellovibrionales bacterium]
MKKALLFTAFSVFVSVPVLASSQVPTWNYMGENGAHKWGELNAEFATCKDGTEQSPINISQYVEDNNLPALGVAYQASPLKVQNMGNSIQVNFDGGSRFDSDDKAYGLSNLSFHTPSEHYIDGAPYPLSGHFMHKADDGSTAIVAVVFKVGQPNPVIEGIWQNVPPVGEVKSVSGVLINPTDLFPDDKSYYTYEGSLTTPPCSEGVKWYVVKEPVEVSAKQLKAFQAVFPMNARPIQTLGDRVVKGN